jgi:diguanylate cyclase (GGDEF)-like protein
VNRTESATVTARLRALRPDSIRIKILVLAAVATVLPSFTTAWILYVENRRSVVEKATEELRSASAQSAREVDLWLKERRYELRVLASSYEITENVTDAPPPASAEPSRSQRRLAEYLRSVQERLADYGDIRVLDARGRELASAGESNEPVVLPPDWQSQFRTAEFLLAEPRWDAAEAASKVSIAVPIRSGEEQLGTMAATIHLQSLAATLRGFAPGATGRVSLLTPQGNRVVISSPDATAAAEAPSYDADVIRSQLASDGEPSELVNAAGEEMIASVRRVAGLDWVVVAESQASEVYRELTQLRNVAILIVAVTLIVVASLGYALGLFIVRPLDRLTRAAAKVADGDLDVDLTSARGGEVGYLTEVFNDMIARLRQSRDELERLSVTDALTGLNNRRRITEVLLNEALRSQRLKHSFAVLMADVDHFKDYNDTHGHPAGDELLKRLATILREETRDVDFVARYGGEEFLVLLPETKARGAVDLASRIQERLAALGVDPVTLSFGVAEFPIHGETGDRLIEVADAALYEAKRAGRNRVVVAAPPVRAVRGSGSELSSRGGQTRR